MRGLPASQLSIGGRISVHPAGKKTLGRGRRGRRLVAADGGGGAGCSERAGDRLGQHRRQTRLPAHQQRKQNQGHGAALGSD